MNSSSLIKFICEQNYQAIEQLLTKKPTSVLETDEHGNTPLHYAVAQCDVRAIKLLSLSPELKPKSNNKHGENALEWYQKYANLSICITSNFFDHVTTYADTFANNDKMQIANIHGNLEQGPILTMRLPKGDNILHLAIRYSQFSMVRLILHKFSDKNCHYLLHGKNFIGETPLALAQKLQRQGIFGTQDIASLIQQRLQKIPDSLNYQPTVNALPEITLNLHDISQLRQYLSKKVTKEDLPNIKVLLPTLVSICYFTCCLTLLQCNEMLCSINQSSQKHKVSLVPVYVHMLIDGLQRQSRWLLHGLLANSNKEIIIYLQEQTLRTASYLANILVQQKVHQFVELGDIVPALPKQETNKPPNELARASYIKDKIIYNVVGRYDLLNATTTILHETTHLALRSCDAFYYPIARDGYGTISLPILDNISQSFKFEYPLRQELLELQFQLENKGSNKENWVQWVCKNNADSLSYCMTYLAANYCGLVEIIEDSNGNYEAFIKINNEFLSNEHIKHFTTVTEEIDKVVLKPVELLTRERNREQDILFAESDSVCSSTTSTSESTIEHLGQEISSLTDQDSGDFTSYVLTELQTNIACVTLPKMPRGILAAL